MLVVVEDVDDMEEEACFAAAVAAAMCAAIDPAADAFSTITAVPIIC